MVSTPVAKVNTILATTDRINRLLVVAPSIERYMHHHYRADRALKTKLTSSSNNDEIMPFDFLTAGYAATVAVGGIIGYVKAGSVPSLAAGLLFGSVLGFGSYQTSRDPSNYALSLGTSMLLGGFMGYRFYNSGKMMPAGLVTILSALMVTRFALRALQGPVKNA